MKYYLYNGLSNNKIKPEIVENFEENESQKLIDAGLVNYPEFFGNLNAEDEVVLIGGDGTINYFINRVPYESIKNNVYYYAAGSGNDFLRDINGKVGEEVLLNLYLKNLPTVYVKDVVSKFINGIGYGLDGYCCEVGDKLKLQSDKPINYTSIAIKGLLFNFKPRNATVIVDGKKYEHHYVWLVPTMKGRFYGGGLMIAPNQDRLSDEVSVVVYQSKSRISSLMTFRYVPTGQHIKKEKMVKIYTGKEIEVQFNQPTALQIDGETVLGVESYRVKA